MFTIKEIEMLIAGLDSIEKVHIAGRMMSGALAKMASGGDPQEEKRIREEIQEHEKKMADENLKERMRINVLKGKLSQLAVEILEERPFDGVKTIE